jgi:hypothetical protein
MIADNHAKENGSSLKAAAAATAKNTGSLGRVSCLSPFPNQACMSDLTHEKKSCFCTKEEEEIVRENPAHLTRCRSITLEGTQARIDHYR